VDLKRLSRIGLLGAFPSGLWLSMTQQSHAETTCSSQTGTNSGYFYPFYLSSGSACMTLSSNDGGGNYSTGWSLGSSGDMVAGKGWNPEIPRIGPPGTPRAQQAAARVVVCAGSSTDTSHLSPTCF